MNITTSNDANFIGATVRANDTLNLNVGHNLNVESVRDEYSSNNKGFNVNAGIGFGSAGANANRTPSLDVGNQSSANAGFSVNNGTSLNKQTVLSSITANNLNVNVKGNTNLKGSLLASGEFDENNKFIDNKNLNFTTNTLTFEDMSNTNYSSNQSLGASANYNLEGTKIVDGKTVPQQGGVSSVSYNASNSLNVNASKTLATLGTGNINIKDTANSDDLSRLNTDTTKINKDLYSASTGTKVDATLDTRLLTKTGQDEIKQEYKDLDKNMKTIANTLPSATSDNKIEAVAGTVWDSVVMVGLDVLPSNGNNGGVLRNIPILTGESDSLYQVQGDPNSKKVYINGILNSPTGALEGGKNLIGEDSFLNLHNPTSGILGDLLESTVDKLGNPIGIKTGISKQIDQYVTEHPDKEYYLHSQGNLITIVAGQNNPGVVFKSFGAPMSDDTISKVFNIPKEDIKKNEGDYVSYPLNIFVPTTWSLPGHATENYGAAKEKKDQEAQGIIK